MAITASGLGSGLDIDGLVSQLVVAERAPVDNRLVRKEAQLQAELSAFGSLKSALSTLQSSLSGLLSLKTFQSRTVTSGSEAFSATAGGNAVTGSYAIEVTQLAKAHSLASGVYSSTSALLGEGQITFRFGATDYDSDTDTYNGFAVNSAKAQATITIDSTNNTLEGVRRAINDANLGVNAAIINDGTGYRLLLSSADTGAENSLEVSVVESGPAGLGQLAFNINATSMMQTVAAQDAQLTINGLAVASASNTVSGAIEDVDLTLSALTSGTPASLTVARDRAAIKTAIKGFINAYNGFVETNNGLSSFNAETLKAGILLGDFTLNSITNRVKQVLGTAIGGSHALQRLADIGITTGDGGKLKLNDAALDDILDSDFDALAGLFTANASIGDSRISYVSSTAKTQPGSYAVEITQLATQAVFLGSGVLPDFATTSLTVNGDNDTLAVKIDGHASGQITLAAGTYTSGAALAAEIEARINADNALRDAGASVSVTYDQVNNRLVINSASFGSESRIEITQVDANTAASLGLSTGAGANGLDVAGSIGGITATGIGKTLTGAVGSVTEGLVINVDGGALGARGNLVYNRGVAERLNELLGQYLGAESMLDLRTTSLSDQIEELGEQRDRLNSRMESFEARTRARFIALDGLLTQLLQTSDYLAQQLANLPGPARPNNS